MKKHKFHFGYIILIAFFLVIIINIAYLFIANRFDNTPIVENAYEKGVQYNKTIAIYEQYKKSGFELDFKINVNQIGDRMYDANISLTNKDGDIANAYIEAIFSNKTHPEYNFYRIFKFSEGLYKSNEMYFATPGSWDVKLVVKKDQSILFQEDKPIIIPEHTKPKI
jgi:nitrogen fixation protein FixH